MVCGGKVLKVTSNLPAALNRLREPRAERLLWVDAICINQDEENHEFLSEKIHQVKLMAVIYRKAERVVVWIGEEGLMTREAFEILPQLAAMFDTRKRMIASLGGDTALDGMRALSWFLGSGDFIGQYTLLEAWPAVLHVMTVRTYFS